MKTAQIYKKRTFRQHISGIMFEVCPVNEKNVQYLGLTLLRQYGCQLHRLVRQLKKRQIV